MSWKQNEILKENLIEQWQEYAENWNGKNRHIEDKMNDIAAELLELGINVDDIKLGGENELLL